MPEPIRVLHIVGAMNRGGVESWLMALLRHADRRDIAMDFLVHTSQPGDHDREIADLNGRIIRCPAFHRPAYLQEFSRALRQHGPYDAVHSHVHYFSGLTTTLARRQGVPIRIAHGHTAAPETGRGPLRASYRAVMRRGIFSSATHLLAVSAEAGQALFGGGWNRRSRTGLAHIGIDFTRFSAEAGPDRASARREFGIGRSEMVVGHVGNFHAVKNHDFLSSVAARMSARAPAIRVLCVGSGPLRERVRARFERDGVRAILAGNRNDVPRLLRAMDVFVFPSIYEGLPLAVLEAQAAGLPCVISETVTPEVAVVPDLIRWLPLSAGRDVWADAALQAARESTRPEAGLAAMRRSPFTVEASFERMRSIYCA